MANPAALLHQQLSAWKKGGNLKHLRKLPSDEGWEDMRFAVFNLQNCLDLLDQMEKEGQQVGAWSVYKNSWNKAVFGLDVSWGGTATGDGGVNEHALHSLLSLATVLDLRMPRIEANGLTSLQDMLDSEVLENPAEDYPFELRAYLVRVRDHLAWCVNHFDKVGEFELHNAAMQFRMTVLFMAAAAPTPKEKDRWSNFVKDKFVWPFITSTFTNGPSNFAASELGELGKQLFEIMPK